MDAAPQRGASAVTPVRRHPKRNEGDAEGDGDILTICIVGEKLKKDDKFIASLSAFKRTITFTTDSLVEAKKYDTSTTAFIIEDFEAPNISEVLHALKKSKATVVGPTAIRELISRKEAIIGCERPLFCHSMAGVGICFSRVKNREKIYSAFKLIQYMGGSVIKEINTRVTHLVADTCLGPKYRFASTFGIRVMSFDWINAAWERRFEADFCADSREFMTLYKIKPFLGLKVFFYGFADEEKLHMVSELVRNGGSECTKPGDPNTTHVVVDDASVTALPENIRAPDSDPQIVKSEWFWASIQMDACADEKMHQYIDGPDPSFLSPLGNYQFSPSTSGRSQSARKRKRRKEAVSQLASLDGGCLQHSLSKRRSSVSELTLLSISGSYLDTPSPHRSVCTSDTNLCRVPSPLSISMLTPTKSPAPHPPTAQSPGIQQILTNMDLRNMSPRQQVFHELVLTEANYTKIIRTILEVFKRPLEDPDIIGGELLNQTEIKHIFGNLPPIFEVHTKMLSEFFDALQNWRDDFSIGEVYLRYAEDLLKAYPPYINFLENSKSMLHERDKSNPRFHAFLKRCQSKPECGRQSLEELMVRPVQRLPSVKILLTDLLKHTKKEKEHPDVVSVEKALEKIKEVLTLINKEKQKTDGQVQIFKICNDIDNCPANLISSHRSFVSKVDVMELGGSDQLCGKGYELCLFLFSDVLEIVKKRSSGKGLGIRSPSTISLRQAGNAPVNTTNPANQSHIGTKPYKHVELINLTAIKRVVDVIVPEDEGDHVFALVCRSNKELKEKMFVLQFLGQDDHQPPKLTFLNQLCRNIANTMYRPDFDCYLTKLKAKDLGLESSDLSVSHFGSRAYRSLHRKVNRAFTFDRTPTSVRLKRAVSSMISPLSKENMGHYQNNVCTTPIGERLRSTPSNELQNLKLSSCTNLMNAGESPSFSSHRSSSILSNSITESPLPMMPPPSMPPLSATPKKASTNGVPSSPSLSSCSDSEYTDSRGGFRTPTLSSVVRRPSLKLKAAILGVGRRLQ